MASALASTSFLQTAIALRTSRPANPRQPVFTLKAAGPDDDGPAAPSSGPNIRFDFGKWVDLKALVPAATPPSGLSFGIQRRKDPGTVFVAGATGQAGARIAQTLLRRGFNVRAGVPDLAAAQELARVAANYKIISKEESKRLNAVDSSFDGDEESIAKAIGNASKVVVTIGPTENGPEAQVTAANALQVIKAAQLAKVSHVAIIYDTSSGVNSTNNVLDGISSFFSNLFTRQPLTVAELLKETVEATDVSYTLVKTKLTDDFSPESAYNIVVSPEGAAAAASSADNDYKVTRSQIASLVGDVFSNTAVAENKVVEVFTDPSAPSKATDELFSAIPEDGRRKVYAEALAKAKAEEEVTKASEPQKKEVEKPKQEEAPNMAAEAQKKAEASVESLLSKAKGVSSSWETLRSQLQSAVQKNSEEEPRVRVATVRGQAKARSLPSLKAVVKNPRSGNSKPKAKTEEPKRETRKVFGGLFKQETIYIDDE